MWRKLMHAWLIGAAVTLAAPEGALRAETNSPSDKIAENSESDAGSRLAGSESGKGLQVFNGAGEPRLGELLADPICQALMRCDGVTPHSLATLVDSVQTGWRDRPDSERT